MSFPKKYIPLLSWAMVATLALACIASGHTVFWYAALALQLRFAWVLGNEREDMGDLFMPFLTFLGLTVQAGLAAAYDHHWIWLQAFLVGACGILVLAAVAIEDLLQ